MQKSNSSSSLTDSRRSRPPPPAVERKERYAAPPPPTANPYAEGDQDDTTGERPMHTIDVSRLEEEYWEEQARRAAEFKREREARAQSILEGKHDSPEESIAHTEARDNPLKWCGWTDKSPMEAKIAFIRDLGELGVTSNPDLFAKFILTLEDINNANNVGQLVWDLFSNAPRFASMLQRHHHASTGRDGQGNTHGKIEKSIMVNLSLCILIEKPCEVLKNTPFQYVTQDEWDLRLHRLKYQHETNVQWFKHMVLQKEHRNVGQSLQPLYQPPESAASEQAVARDTMKQNEKQKLMAFLFNCAADDGLRRTEKAVYAPTITPEGQNTRCYEHIADMDPWIRHQVCPRPVENHWFGMKGDTPKYLVSHLGHDPDPRFPFLERCRTLFSFRNGIYCAHENKFYCYVDAKTALHKKNLHTVYELPPNVATAKYFDVRVPLEWFEDDFDYRNIPCPRTESIFEAQWYDLAPDGKTHIPDKEAIDWAQSLLGRLQHNVGDLDDWQNTIHLEGPAKTGKSVLLKLIALWYFATDIGLIGDSSEKNFPDQHLINKLLVMCMDISHMFQLSPTRFLSWCSGDWLEVHRKGLEALCMKWTAPSIWASNGPPPIVGNAGSTRRRYIIFQFLKAILNADGRLYTDAAAESGYHLIKCSMGYHNKLKKYGKCGLYDNKNILPKRFHNALDEYAQASSWTDFFLGSGMFDFDAKYDMSIEAFKTLYGNFKQNNQLKGVNKWHEAVVPDCKEVDFANSLNDRGCKWDSQNELIIGLRPNDKAPTLSSTNNNNTSHDKRKKNYNHQQQHQPLPQSQQPPPPSQVNNAAPAPAVSRPVADTMIQQDPALAAFITAPPQATGA